MHVFFGRKHEWRLHELRFHVRVHWDLLARIATKKIIPWYVYSGERVCYEEYKFSNVFLKFSLTTELLQIV